MTPPGGSTPPADECRAAVTVRKVNADLADLADQYDVDALVNPWNRNYMPRWLLVPGGVSKALKRRTGAAPWKQLARAGVLPVAGCVVTDAGRLSSRTKIIHVAGLNLLWRATETTVHASAHSVVRVAVTHRMHRIAMPLIGSGSGGLDRASSLRTIEAALSQHTHGDPLEVLIVAIPTSSR